MNTDAPLTFAPNPPGFRAEDMGGQAEGFLPVSDLARKNRITDDQAVRAIQERGWELRAWGRILYYRPAIVTKMGRP